MSNDKEINILLDDFAERAFLKELNKFIGFYKVGIEVNSKKVFYNFLNIKNSKNYLFSNNDICCEVGFEKKRLVHSLTKEQFRLNIMLLGQFLFSDESFEKYRPHDLGMDKSHVSFVKGCFRGQEVIARTEHLSKKKKEIIPIHQDDEIAVNAEKFKVLQETSMGQNIFKLVSFFPN